MTITLTTEQANALLGLINLAVKAGGLEVASTAVFFQNALSKAFKDQQNENPVGLLPDGSGPG